MYDLSLLRQIMVKENHFLRTEVLIYILQLSEPIASIVKDIFPLKKVNTILFLLSYFCFIS